MSEIEKVGVAEVKVSENPTTLVSYGLGSCVAVAIYDPNIKIGGLAHVMLPESAGRAGGASPGKFADTGISYLVGELIKRGAHVKRMRCKIAGGSQMFKLPGTTHAASSLENMPRTQIGERNIEAVKQTLRDHSIKIVAEETGGDHGRTVRFNPSTGEMEVSTIAHGKKMI
ncbi:MAG: chemotaxis protein CheD [Actinobacteria bacterium]|nr:chemotaxis protein CheD [Actinomycetota bacterium]